MILIKTIDKEIKLHENNWAFYKKMEELKKHQKRVAFLRACKRYLETEPTEDFIQTEINKQRESNIRCEEKLRELKRNQQEVSLIDIKNNMRGKIKANNKHLDTLLFIQNKQNGQDQGTLI